MTARSTLAALVLLASSLGAQATSGQIVTADSVTIHYKVFGTGRDTIIALHGGPGFSSTYLLPGLEGLGRNHVVIAYDQRGSGRSTVITDSIRLRLADHVRDLDAVRQHFGLRQATLLGHSWGAGLAAFYAKAHPDRVNRMILVGAMPPRRTPYMTQFGQNLRAWMDSATTARVSALAAARRDATDVQAACRAYWGVFIRGYLADPRDDAALARFRGDVCSDPPESIRNAGRVGASVLGPMGDWDWREDFHALGMPVLILHGSNDPIPAESAPEWKAAFPNSTLHIIAGSGHFPQVEQPAEFVRLVNAFLR